MIEIIKACPHCKGDHIEVHESGSYMGHDPEIAYVCLGCGLKGPDTYTVAYALDLWNSLPRSKDCQVIG
jgi:hypothetical protein